jgi:K+-sensing histidine kinase KdpD
MNRITAKRDRVNNILRILSEGTASEQGEKFFRSLVHSLASALQVRYAFVTECTNHQETQVKTLAFWDDRDYAKNVTYAVAGTPCEEVMKGRISFHPTDLQALFPKSEGPRKSNAISYLGLPIFGSSGAVAGHLAALDEKPLRVAPEEISTLRVFADRAGMELERYRAEEAAERYTRRLEMLQQLDRAILAAQSPAVTGHAAVTHIRQLIPCRRASVTMFDFESGESVVQAIYSEDETGLGPGGRLPLDTFGSLDALREGHVIVITDARALHNTKVFNFLRTEGLLSWLNVPLIAQGKLIGTLNVGSERVNAFSSEDVDVAREAANRLSIAIQQAQLYDQVKRQTLDLERLVAERTASLEAFSYSVSHDLRAPLRAIDGFSRMLLEDHAHKLNQECNRLLRIICNSAEYMGQLIDDLLAFSRLGRREMKLVDIDMCELARSVSNQLVSSESDRKIEVRIGELPLARGDPTMIRQVFANLLSNCMKFARLEHSPRIEIGYQSEDSETTYFVKDNGVGFDMDHAGKMFGVFQRLHAADEFEGTGAGLAIVQLIIQRHGGCVWAQGKCNEGATIFFTLPRGAGKKWSMSIP